MSKIAKWMLVAALLAVPTVGLAVTKYRAHKTCPATPDCPCEHAQR